MTDIERLRAVGKAATEGPWELHMVQPDMGGRHQYGLRGAPRGPRGAVIGGTFRAVAADAEFIATARNEWDALLDRLEAAEAKVERVERVAEDHRGTIAGMDLEDALKGDEE